MWKFSLFAAWLLRLTAVDGYSLIPTGITVELDGIPYYVPPDTVGRLSTAVHDAPSGNFSLLPITVTSTNQASFGRSDLESLRTNFTRSDDVFQNAFLQGTLHSRA